MTDKIPILLSKIYTSFMDLMFYSNDPLDLLDNYVAEDVMGYGTTLDEKIFDLKGLKDLAILQRNQSTDLKFNYDLIPVYRKMMKGSSTAIIVDEIKISMQIEGEEVNLNVRMSSVWDLVEGNWKILHWHGSKPEYDSGGTDTWHTEEWQKKNEKLQKQVEEKTAELIDKNRDLEIEASLERIRAIAMSMQKAEGLLTVVEILYKELKTLGFTDIRNTIINIFNDKKESFLNYDYSDYGVGGINEVDYNSHPSNIELVNKMREANDEFMITEFTGDELDEWRKWRIDQGQMPDAKLDQAESLYYYEYSIGVGTIGISTFSPINADQLKILNKIRNVFNLAYRRYADIEQAEAHAREAQIEAALERVRARSMAMHKSEELADLSLELVKQVQALGVDTWFCAFNIYDDSPEGSLEWGSNGQGTFPKYRTPREGVFLRYYEAGQNGETLLINEIDEKECPAHYNYLCSLPGVGDQLLKMKDAGIPFPTSQIDHAAFFKYGYILFITFEPVPEAHDIFKRFAKVFEQTYTRFLDLQKSEEQAKEAKIEAALERVRAKSMAMHNSEQLSETAMVMFEQLCSLGQVPDRIGIVIYNEQQQIFENWITDQSGMQLTNAFISSIEEPTTFAKIYKGLKEKIDSIVIDLTGEELKSWLQFIKGNMKMFINESNIKNRRVHYASFFSHGSLMCTFHEPVADNFIQLLVRFAKVFDQTYTRFLDLKKAEEQAREAQIEAALEKVRSRSLAMHTAKELGDVVIVLVEKLKDLGVVLDANGVVLCTYFNDTRNVMHWIASPDFSFAGSYLLPYFKHPIFDDAWESKESGIEYFSKAFSKDEKDSFFKYAFEHSDYKNFPEDFKQWVFQNDQHILSFAWQKNSAILIPSHTGVAPEGENIVILKRFAKVFEQAYVRFLDLKKVEEQAREAQIELSLERIRAQVTAMSESSGLLDIVVTMRNEFVALGHEAHYFWYMRYHPETYEKAMTSGDGAKIGMVMSLPRHIHGDIKLIDDWEKSDDPTVVFAMDVETAVDYIQKMITLGDFKQVDPNAPTLDDIRHIGGLTFIMARTAYGEIGFSLPGTVPDPPQESLDTLVRFASVFDLAYSRFEDLKDAEQRNRETQIELALERVRAKTMAMHNSQDVGATVITLFEEVLNLGIDKSIRLGIGILAGYERMETWSANSNSKGETVLKMGMLDMTIHPMLVGLKKAWKGGKKNYSYDYIGEDVYRYYEALNREPDYPFHADLKALPENEYHRSFFHPEGILFSFAPDPISEEAAKVLDRFAHVFGQTYRRYRDLQKAEEQAREAQIEAALERIRSQAMAMQHSDDLFKSTTILFDELEKLELPLERCGIGIFDKKTRDCQLYTTVVNDEGKKELATGITSLTIHPMLIKTFDAWKVQESLSYVLEGKELEDYYKLVSKSRFHLPEDVINKSVSLVKEYYFYTPFGAGGLYVFSDAEPTNEEIKVIRRFAEVFHMTYTRYEDLQKAEVRALEAVKQASLDRVRGEIAGMRTPEDLQHITPLIWSELEILEVPFIRCGVFIIDEAKSNVQVHLTTSNGKPIGALNLPLDANELSHNTVEHWRKKKVYTIHWNKEDFISWMQSMISLGQIETPEQYQGYTKPPESLDLHFIPFKQGMLYVGNVEPLLPEKIDLVKTLAEAFSIAYARYEDFVDLEEAKTRVEKTLNELKSTQSQLIHSEKMASLGELTAGIAHEIQNPLNFVNNFSEVSVDLMEELGEEMATGNTEEVNAIAEDLKQNLEKITSHGQRASFIVRGMLEHSRTNKGDKKLTDINALADEYLRLAYHGLRAKDKSFNADFKTEFDENLPKISVNSQDLGRVLLNLINNAFFAVSSKALATDDSSYKPSVTISTKILEDKIEIRVKDNGNGIPQHIKDKIFQPFFTTKPTGEGTGLGLSMSYDIITKGHGGELKVETKENEGTTFIISIPLNS